MEAEALLFPSVGLLEDAGLSGVRPNIATNSRTNSRVHIHRTKQHCTFS
jgi:hypothetical protein